MAKTSHQRPSAPEPLAALAAVCRERGLAATTQRLAVLAALRAAHDHPSPEALFARLRPVAPSLSLGTVYKTLHRLAEVGLAREVSVAGDNARRFDGNLDLHQHLVCERCRRVTDLYDATLARVTPPRRLGGFRASGVAVHVLGLCEACAAPPRPPASRRGARRPR